jgi:UDP-N-acetylmuramoyl-tripeptide--D-alanyl-D-alanine ligase
LSQRHRVFSTPGNLNNHLGVPLCLLRLRGQEDLAILELGANHLGETRLLCQIAQPNYGLITNCGKDHLGEYGSWENVIQANTELYDYLAEHGGKALVNAGDALLLERSAPVRDRYFYGGTMSNWTIALIQEIPLWLEISNEEDSHVVKTQFFGAFWQENIAHALALGQIFAVDLASACAAIEAYRPQNLRSEWRNRPPHQFLLDCYNANPSSMAHFIQAAQIAHAPNKLLILGEMLELGQYSQEEHQNLAQSLDSAAFQAIAFIGKEWENIERPAHSHYFQQTAEAKTWLEAFLLQFPQGALVLLKGSRGNRLEGLVE